MSDLPTHLGDGAYLDHDGWQFWLAVNHHENRVVALEPGAYWALVERSSMHLASYGPPERREAVAARLEFLAAKIRSGGDAT